MISGYLRGDNRFLCVRETKTTRRIKQHDKNKDLSSTICEYRVRLECMNLDRV